MTTFRPLPPIPTELLYFNLADWPEPGDEPRGALATEEHGGPTWAVMSERHRTIAAEARARDRWKAAQSSFATRHRAGMTDFYVAAATQRRQANEDTA